MIEMLSMWVILGLVVFAIAGVVSAEMDSSLAALVTLIIGIVVVEWGLGISVWATLLANPLWIVAGLVLYVAAGGLYTVVWRWPEFIRQHKDQIMSGYLRWAANIQTRQNNSFDTYLDSSNYEYHAKFHAERLTTWIILWPFSLSWELARKPAFWLGKTIYYSLGNSLQRVGRNTARKLHDSSK